jgi:hypothetical protein
MGLQAARGSSWVVSLGDVCETAAVQIFDHRLKRFFEGKRMVLRTSEKSGGLPNMLAQQRDGAFVY